MCARWADSFEAFVEDMGNKPADLSIDRIDGSKGYTPDNCRWATDKQQAQNRKNNVFTENSVREIRALHKDGNTRTQIAALFGVSLSAVCRVISGECWSNVTEEEED